MPLSPEKIAEIEAAHRASLKRDEEVMADAAKNWGSTSQSSEERAMQLKQRERLKKSGFAAKAGEKIR